MIFAGDLFLGDREVEICPEFQRVLNSKGPVVVNLESPLLEKNDLESRCDKASILNTTPSILSRFTEDFGSRFIFSLCNNHINDRGAFGLNQTIKNLSRMKKESFGAGTLDDVSSPLIHTIDGKRVAIIATSTEAPEVMAVRATKKTPGILDYKFYDLCDIICHLRNQVDFIVVYPHWGIEYLPLPSYDQRIVAHRWIDAGADLIIGHHTHCIQGKEIYKDKTIYYSLGNFCFSEFFFKTGDLKTWTDDSNHSLLLEIDFSGDKLITEHGVHYCPKSHKLRFAPESIEICTERSSWLCFETTSKKSYYNVWEQAYFNWLFRNKLTLSAKIKSLIKRRYKNKGVIMSLFESLRRIVA